MMGDSTQNGAPVFAVQSPIEKKSDSYFAFPDSVVYPQMYIIAQQQQQQPSTSCTNSAWFGRTSVIGLGIALVSCGVLSQIGASLGFRFCAGLSEAGAGIWCGYTFQAAGAVALVAAHYGNKNLIFWTAVTAGSAVVASIIQLSISAAGLAKDDHHFHGCNHSHNNSGPAHGANIMMLIAALSAFIGGVWLLGAACIAIRRKQISFQNYSTPVQDVYQQQQQQQWLSLNYPHPNTINLPMAPQVVQMPVTSFPLQMTTTSTIPNQQVVQMPVASFPLQTTTASTIPNQQVLQLPVQLILNALQHHFDEEMRNRQMLSIPTQFVAQLQQPTALNNTPANTIDPATFSQLQEHLETPKKNDDRDVEKSLHLHPKINTGENLMVA